MKHTDLANRAGLTIHIPDKCTQYEISPYASDYDAVVAVGFTFKTIPVEQQLTIILCF